MRRWIAPDFDYHDWPFITLWLAGAQVMLAALSAVVDALALPAEPLCLFRGYSGVIRARRAGWPQRWPAQGRVWALLATFLPVVGALAYARHRSAQRRLPPHSPA